MDILWLGGPPPAMRLEAHYGDRVIPCFVDRPAGLFDLFANAVRSNPDGEAVVCGGQRLSWRELGPQAARVGDGLAGRGIRARDRIGLLVGNRPYFVIAPFAAARLGAVAVPMGIRPP